MDDQDNCSLLTAIWGNMAKGDINRHLAQLIDSVLRFLPSLTSAGARTTFAQLANSDYPAAYRDYIDLLNHPASNDDDYRNEADSGSILHPYLFVWLAQVGSDEEIHGFCSRLKEMLPNYTYWAQLPDEGTEELIWNGKTCHGVCVADLSPRSGVDQVTKSGL
ncbi:hypothetical protein [Yoonia sp. R2-816]|uniref:hypothetical protein n=1 Tax=Yoonia sp. R2-816 TaxID=3342638 RepID=UPI0037278D45